jgi:hypothetical protein
VKTSNYPKLWRQRYCPNMEQNIIYPLIISKNYHNTKDKL